MMKKLLAGRKITTALAPLTFESLEQFHQRKINQAAASRTDGYLPSSCWFDNVF